jgi:hypothetical protein
MRSVAVSSSARPALGCIPFSIDRLIVHAAREVQMIAAMTPADAHHERARLTDAIRQGKGVSPEWTYAPMRHDELRHALAGAERALARDHEPRHELYLSRVRELGIEAALCASAGTPEVAHLARARFAPADGAVAHEAWKLCTSWLANPPDATGGAPLASDAPDPRSLLSRMRAAVGSLRLPFSVVVRPSLAALAATGERVILVAADRLVHDEDVARTVLHEIEGHALPRIRSRDSRLGLLRAGTARGVDDQEGRAVLLEQRAGMLGPRRRHQLATRHLAALAMLDGATFVDVAAMLIDEHGLNATDAVIIAERVFRGSNGRHPGLGRERVYLESFVRVQTHLAQHPEDEWILSSGQVAVDAVDGLREWVDPMR